ncbi:MAG: S41 family peptidase, partial [Rhodothermales bacterium]|nr:S41 family peptidase [Rhodothermales bacterium]
LVLGQPSFGKGLVQVVRPLPYNTSLKITTAHYYIPSGRSIQAIDYRADGGPAAVPDSLRRTFRTAGGRAVRDGKGIEPDVLVSRGEESELEAALRRRAAFFFFANHYAAVHRAELPAPAPRDTAATPEDRFFRPEPTVALDLDAVLREFRDWLDAEDFSYRTAAEREVDDLADALRAAGYAGTDDEVRALRAAVAKAKQADFERYAPRLKELLRAEITARYAGPTDQIRAGLEHDAPYRAALDLLRDPATFRKAMKGTS